MNLDQLVPQLKLVQPFVNLEVRSKTVKPKRASGSGPDRARSTDVPHLIDPPCEVLPNKAPAGRDVEF